MNIRHSRPYLGKEELAAVRSVILSRQLAQGSWVERLEKGLAARVGRRYGAAVSSGTAALYCALRGLGVERGHDVVIPTYVCTALLNAVLMCGAQPVLSDVDPVTGNLTPELVKKKLTKRTKAVIVPHLFGYPADVQAIEKLGVPVIEDCAQCVGTAVSGKEVGGLSAVSVFSFYATKMIAAGEGGMVATSDRRVAERVVTLREYDNREHYVPAFNFKLSELHAALALAQFGKLPEMVRLRRMAARSYWTLLNDCSPALQLPTEESGVKPVYFRFVVKSTVDTGPVIRALREKGVECGKPVFKPLHRYLKQTGFPGADRLQKSSLSLPLYPGLTRKEIAVVVRLVVQQVRGRV